MAQQEFTSMGLTQFEADPGDLLEVELFLKSRNMPSGSKKERLSYAMKLAAGSCGLMRKFGVNSLEGLENLLDKAKKDNL